MRVLALVTVLVGVAVALPMSVSAATILDQNTANTDAGSGVGTGASNSQVSTDAFGPDSESTPASAIQAPEVAPATVAAEEGVPLSDLYGTCVQTPTHFCPSSVIRGTASPAGDTNTAATANGSFHCWQIQDNSTMATWWGIPPYETNIAEHRRWCGNYAVGITYVATHVHANSWLSNCTWSASDLYNQRYSGGTGYHHITRTTGGVFHCPYITFAGILGGFNVDRWQRWATSDIGRVWRVARSCNLLFGC